jgi:hypothetical protein
MRYFLNMTALIPCSRDTGANAGFKGEQASFPQCEAGHDTPTLLDPTGNHATACKQGAKARYGLHERINRVIIHFGRTAGALAAREPDTASLLRNFCSRDECRTWFPKKNNPATRTRAANLRWMLEQASLMERGTGRTAVMNKIHDYAMATPGGTKGLRIDIQLLFDDEELWIDGGAVHPTSYSTEAAVTKWVKNHSAANKEAGGLLRVNGMLMQPSPNVRTACNTKHTTYKGLLDIAASQVKTGERSVLPTFVAAIISHTGEMAPELHTLVETITVQYARTITQKDMEDGVSKGRRTGMFRSQFKDALMTAMAEGFGSTLAGAGRVHVPYVTKQRGLEGYTAFLPSSSYPG